MTIHITDDQIAEMQVMRQDGVSWAGIGDEFGVSRTVVLRRLDPSYCVYQLQYQEEHKERLAVYRAKYRSENKEQHAAYGAAFYAENKEHFAEYYLENKDRIAAYNVEHKEEIAERSSKWYAENKELVAAHKTEYYTKNKERIAAYGAEYYAKNKEKVAERQAKYRIKNPDKRCALTAKRKALKLAATVGNLEDIKEIYRQAAEDKGIVCYLCGEKIPLGERNVDHVFPLSKGGEHSARNLKITHAACNLQKGAKIFNGEGKNMEKLTRSERLDLLDDCVCPVCGERHVSYEELLACLMDHDDNNIDIACEFINEARDLMFQEDAEEILENYDDMN